MDTYNFLNKLTFSWIWSLTDRESFEDSVQVIRIIEYNNVNNPKIYTIKYENSPTKHYFYTE